MGIQTNPDIQTEPERQATSLLPLVGGVITDAWCNPVTYGIQYWGLQVATQDGMIHDVFF